MIRVAICDDEPAFVGKVEGLARRFFDGQGMGAEIDCFTSPLAFVSGDLTSYQLVLLDVSMGEMDGIQAAKALRELRHRKSSVTLTIQNQPVTVELAGLLYLESRRHLLCAHLATGAELEFYGRLQD